MGILSGITGGNLEAKLIPVFKKQLEHNLDIDDSPRAPAVKPAGLWDIPRNSVSSGDGEGGEQNWRGGREREGAELVRIYCPPGKT